MKNNQKRESRRKKQSKKPVAEQEDATASAKDAKQLRRPSGKMRPVNALLVLLVIAVTASIAGKLQTGGEYILETVRVIIY